MAGYVEADSRPGGGCYVDPAEEARILAKHQEVFDEALKGPRRGTETRTHFPSSTSRRVCSRFSSIS